MKLKPEDNLNAWQDAAGKDPIDIDMEPPPAARPLRPSLPSLPSLNTPLVLLILGSLVLILWAYAGSLDGVRHQIIWLFWAAGHSIRFLVLLTKACIVAFFKGLFAHKG